MLAAIGVVSALVVLYLATTLVAVVRTGQADQARPVDAIVVLGAAQFDGRPSPILQARLDHALDLWRGGYSDMVVVTGGKQPGDRFTEATVSAEFLIANGVPDAAILREVQGRTTWESMSAVARILGSMDRNSVLLVSDPYHMHRARGMARELGLEAYVSATRTSPEAGGASRYVREMFGVSAAQVIGYGRLSRWAD